jgi:hypothetical protein
MAKGGFGDFNSIPVDSFCLTHLATPYKAGGNGRNANQNFVAAVVDNAG